MTSLSLPIEEHGVIGDLYTVALVATNGTIDWCCLPQFDSLPVFGALLDSERGGEFRLHATHSTRTDQSYLSETNILTTRFYCADGLAEIQDFMPVQPHARKSVHEIVRRVHCMRGLVEFEFLCNPQLDFGLQKLSPERISEREVRFVGESDFCYGLILPEGCEYSPASGKGSFRLSAGQECHLVFYCAPQNNCAPKNNSAASIAVQVSDVQQAFSITTDFWRQWVSRSTYTGRWRDQVMRSALVLKLMTFQPTGAIVAAPTTSLPETLGGDRNWDYRYTWIRDASFTTYALMRLGYDEEARNFIHWLHDRLLQADETAIHPLQVMYSVDGALVPHEVERRELSGYRKSKPVRFGNNAAHQLQLDIYGELIDSIYLFHKHKEPLSYELWKNVRALATWVTNNWDQPDEGIWEVRSGKQNFVFSRVMCWVALDRAIRMSIQSSLPAPIEEWRHARDRIYEQVMERGWNSEVGAFTQHYDTTELDASLLLMPLVKFISPNDPRMLSTIGAIERRLSLDGLVFRYDPAVSPDGLGSSEGSFTMCSFWLIECLSRAGQLEKARMHFERILGLGNHLGLYAEQIGIHGEALGNFPQAFTHLALISAACDLDRRLG